MVLDGFGERLKLARQAANLTQAELARKVGLATGSIYQYEAGLRFPRTEILQKITDVLGTDINYLLHGATLADRDEAFINRLRGDGETNPAVIHEMHEQQSQREALNQAFDQLNREGQKKAIERIQELTEIPRYRAESPAQGQQQPAGPEADKDPTNE